MLGGNWYSNWIKNRKFDTKKINAIIASGIIIAVILTVVLITVPLLYFVSLDIEKKSIENTETALDFLTIIIKDCEQKAQNSAVAIALNPAVKEYIETRDAEAMADLLKPMLQQSRLDAITVTDAYGVVICRVHDPLQYGDSLAKETYVQTALKGAAFTVTGKGLDGKLRAGGGVPVRGAEGQVIGMVAVDYSLEEEIVVDIVKQIFKIDATLFSGDIRVATTIVEDGQRAVGTRLLGDIADIVLKKGQKYVGRASIIGKKYITAYQPIIGSEGKPVGAMFAGQNLMVFEREKDRMLVVAGVVALAAIIISIVIAISIGRIISKPMIRSVRLLKQSEEQFRQMFTKQQAIMWLVEPQTLTIIDANEAAQSFYGYSLDEFRKLKITDLIMVSEDTVKITHNKLRQSSNQFLEAKARLANGVSRYVEVRKTLISLDSKEFFFDIVNDITERKKAEERLFYNGFHDALTGLYNRAYFEDVLSDNNRLNSSLFGIIICDLDGLKMINDTFGHEYGDQMLVNVANILQECCGDGRVVARIGGDEFAIVLAAENEDCIKDIYEKIRTAISEYNKSNQDFPLSLSMGYAIGQGDAISIRTLYKEADNIMYREKLHRSQSTRSSIVQTVMKLLEARDYITEGHADRLTDIVTSLGVAIGLPAGRIADLRLLAQFHDIGKVGVPDKILLKPAKLTPEETIEMRRHCEIGHRIALASADLAPIADWILKHQEWWNGGGYPLGLAGEDIPLECRILAIADAYDAMTSDRLYRSAISHGEAVAELQRCAGTQFDPELVEKFCENCVK